MKMKSLLRRHETTETTLARGAGGVNALDRTDRNRLLKTYYPLVKSVVQGMLSRLPSCADADELESVGVQGLVAAVEKYDYSQEHTFKGYVVLRIRGAILDELRRLDALPRTRRMKVRKLKQTVEILEQRLGRVPTDLELADELHMNSDEFYRFQEKAQPIVLISLDGTASEENESINLHEIIPNENDVTCLDKIQKEELMETLLEVIGDLPERHQQVVQLYYYQQNRLVDIAQHLGVSEARVCQIHSQAIKQMRKSIELVV